MGPLRDDARRRARVRSRSPAATPAAAPGIQADLKTFSALGVYGMTAITAVTVQNTEGVYGYEAIAPELVGEQIRAVATDIGVDAAKTGMLARPHRGGHRGRGRRTVIGALEHIPNLVVDPVRLEARAPIARAEDAVAALRVEAPAARDARDAEPPRGGGPGGPRGRDADDMRRAADAILALGPAARSWSRAATSRTRTDARSTCSSTARARRWLDRRRIDTPHTHGTGCTLSAAIAAHLAAGMRPATRPSRAGKAFVTRRSATRSRSATGSGRSTSCGRWRRPADPPEDTVGRGSFRWGATRVDGRLAVAARCA